MLVKGGPGIRVNWGNDGHWGMSDKTCMVISHAMHAIYSSIGILQYINLVCSIIFTYQLLIPYANKRATVTWFKVRICKKERTYKLENPTSAVGVKSDNCGVMSDTDVLGTYWWNIGFIKSGFCKKKKKNPKNMCKQMTKPTQCFPLQ